MKREDLPYEELPTSQKFLATVDKEMIRWEAYEPTTIEADIPFKDHWWKYVYWMPTLKKEFYLEGIRANIFEEGIEKLALKYGMDADFFYENYKHIVRTAKWMRRNNITRKVSGESL